MSDIGELIVRMSLSLGVVLGLTTIAFWFVRRRTGVPGPIASGRKRTRLAPVKPLEIEARAGLARGSAAIAVRFADRIVLVGVSDGAPAVVLAEIPADDWDREPDDDDGASAQTRTPIDPNSIVAERPSFLEALRDATSRRP